MISYVLSEAAKNDMQEIFSFGTHKFGRAQATKYLKGFKEHCETIAKNPHIGKARNEIIVGLFSIPYVSHIIFYRILPDRIRIVRVLHNRSDIPKHFKKP